MRGDVAAPALPPPPDPLPGGPWCGGEENLGPTLLAAAASPWTAAAPSCCCCCWRSGPKAPAEVGQPAVLAAGMPDLLPSTASLAAEDEERTPL
jgi:hypothetical protein